LASSTITATGGTASATITDRFTHRSRPVYCMMNANHAGGSRQMPSHLASPHSSLVDSSVAASSRAYARPHQPAAASTTARLAPADARRRRQT
jgi:hypothetical protein